MACIKKGILLLNVNPMLIFVPCRFGYQLIDEMNSYLFFLLYFCLIYYYLYSIFKYVKKRMRTSIYTSLRGYTNSVM